MSRCFTGHVYGGTAQLSLFLTCFNVRMCIRFEEGERMKDDKPFKVVFLEDPGQKEVVSAGLQRLRDASRI